MSSQPRGRPGGLAIITASGGITIATTDIAIAAVTENSRTTSHANVISVRQLPISTK